MKYIVWGVLTAGVWYARCLVSRYWHAREDTKEAVVGLLGVLGWGMNFILIPLLLGY